MLRDLLVQTLHDAGYITTRDFSNGKLAWEALQKIGQEEAPLDDSINILISDIEMPQMDGHHLLTQIREHNKLGKLPVIFFSSLINEEMRRKGEVIGANGQISKPEIGQLIDLIDSLVFKK